LYIFQSTISKYAILCKQYQLIKSIYYNTYTIQKKALLKIAIKNLSTILFISLEDK